MSTSCSSKCILLPGLMDNIADSYLIICEFDKCFRQAFPFVIFFLLSSMFVRKLVSGLNRKYVSTGVKKPGTTCILVHLPP